jgi:hypothetical protein
MVYLYTMAHLQPLFFSSPLKPRLVPLPTRLALPLAAGVVAVPLIAATAAAVATVLDTVRFGCGNILSLRFEPPSAIAVPGRLDLDAGRIVERELGLSSAASPPFDSEGDMALTGVSGPGTYAAETVDFRWEVRSVRVLVDAEDAIDAREPAYSDGGVAGVTGPLRYIDARGSAERFDSIAGVTVMADTVCLGGLGRM